MTLDTLASLRRRLVERHDAIDAHADSFSEFKLLHGTVNELIYSSSAQINNLIRSPDNITSQAGLARDLRTLYVLLRSSDGNLQVDEEFKTSILATLKLHVNKTKASRLDGGEYFQSPDWEQNLRSLDDSIVALGKAVTRERTAWLRKIYGDLAPLEDARDKKLFDDFYASDLPSRVAQLYELSLLPEKDPAPEDRLKTQVKSEIGEYAKRFGLLFRITKTFSADGEPVLDYLPKHESPEDMQPEKRELIRESLEKLLIGELHNRGYGDLECNQIIDLLNKLNEELFKELGQLRKIPETQQIDQIPSEVEVPLTDIPVEEKEIPEEVEIKKPTITTLDRQVSEIITKVGIDRLPDMSTEASDENLHRLSLYCKRVKLILSASLASIEGSREFVPEVLGEVLPDHLELLDCDFATLREKFPALVEALRSRLIDPTAQLEDFPPTVQPIPDESTEPTTPATPEFSATERREMLTLSLLETFPNAESACHSVAQQVDGDLLTDNYFEEQMQPRIAALLPRIEHFQEVRDLYHLDKIGMSEGEIGYKEEALKTVLGSWINCGDGAVLTMPDEAFAEYLREMDQLLYLRNAEAGMLSREFLEFTSPLQAENDNLNAFCNLESLQRAQSMLRRETTYDKATIKDNLVAQFAELGYGNNNNINGRFGPQGALVAASLVMDPEWSRSCRQHAISEPLPVKFSVRKGPALARRDYNPKVNAGGSGKDTTNSGRELIWDFATAGTLSPAQVTVLTGYFPNGKITCRAHDQRSGALNESAALKKINSIVRKFLDNDLVDSAGYMVQKNPDFRQMNHLKTTEAKERAKLFNSVLEGLIADGIFVVDPANQPIRLKEPAEIPISVGGQHELLKKVINLARRHHIIVGIQ